MPSEGRRSVIYGQNFLRSRRLVERLLTRSGIGPDDLVVEIGPGEEIVTEPLAEACRQVLAIEKDPVLARRLRGKLTRVANVALFEADFLDVPLPLTGYKVFASIPFNATAAIVGRLTAEPWAALDAFLVVQREAAERFVGEPRGTLAATLLRPWFEPTVVHRFRPTDFRPAPGVEVVLLRLRKRGPPLVAPEDAQAFRDFVVSAYTAWRPTVREALAGVLGTATVRHVERRSGVDLGRPPASVRFEEWLELFAAFLAHTGPAEYSAIRGAEKRLRGQQVGLRKEHRTRAPGRNR